MAQKKTPADRVIKAFGGVRATARVLDISPGAVSRWNSPADKGGTAGRVPSARQYDILREAKKRGLDLKAEDLIAK
jgi:hypothetical protein